MPRGLSGCGGAHERVGGVAQSQRALGIERAQHLASVILGERSVDHDLGASVGVARLDRFSQRQCAAAQGHQAGGAIGLDAGVDERASLVLRGLHVVEDHHHAVEVVAPSSKGAQAVGRRQGLADVGAGVVVGTGQGLEEALLETARAIEERQPEQRPFWRLALEQLRDQHGLTGTGAAEHRHQPVALQHRRHLGELGLATAEMAHQTGGRVAREPGRVDGSRGLDAHGSGLRDEVGGHSPRRFVGGPAWGTRGALPRAEGDPPAQM